MLSERRRGRRWLILQAGMLAVLSAIVIALQADYQAPARFDGAGYAVLARSLGSGQGYREIDHPDRPRHAHYPPGYPIMLATLWRATGPSVVAARVFATTSTAAAVVAAWWWFRRMFTPRTAFLLGAALALNWTWARTGGEIQSEPLYLLLGQIAVLGTGWRGWRGGMFLGLVLAATILTRHVGAALALAIGLDMLLRRRRVEAAAAGTTAAVLILPWVVWVASVGRHTQIALFGRGGLPYRIISNGLFYLERLPDQIAGPFVEVATVFAGSKVLAIAAALAGAVASALIGWGWLRCLRSPRTQLAALVPLWTLIMLLAWPFQEAGRFLIPLVPFILVGTLIGLAGVLGRVGLRRPRTLAAGALLVVSFPYTSYMIATGGASARQEGFKSFDGSCAWIVREASRPGPVLTTQHAGEVFLLTARQALAPSDAGSNLDAVIRQIEQYKVAYLLLDGRRYAGAPDDPLERLPDRFPDRFRLVQGSPDSARVYEVIEPEGALE